MIAGHITEPCWVDRSTLSSPESLKSGTRSGSDLVSQPLVSFKVVGSRTCICLPAEESKYNPAVPVSLLDTFMSVQKRSNVFAMDTGMEMCSVLVPNMVPSGPLASLSFCHPGLSP